VEGSDKTPDREERAKKLKELQQGLNDIRQGLVTIQEYYSFFSTLSLERGRDPEGGSPVALPTLEESGEFESLWHFLKDHDTDCIQPSVSFGALYELYTEFCRRRGLNPVDRDAFHYILLSQTGHEAAKTRN
jgi:hypothetical protein